MKKEPLVVIFGRTNVGKSTLFNCLVEKRSALVSEIEGTTRDSNIGRVEWNNGSFQLVDTGGIMDLRLLQKKKIAIEASDIDAKVQIQARAYLEKADLILFLVDTRTGLLPQDKEMVLTIKKILPRTDNIILVANKADSPRHRKEVAEFNKLALGEPLPVSATTGSGTGDLLDEIIKRTKTGRKKSSSLIEEKKEEEVDEAINVCIIGKPNVGKSSLINAILGEDRVIVSPVPHTTREPKDISLEYNGKTIKLIDTAGISRRGQQTARSKRNRETLEKFSILKSLGVLRKAEVALFVFDVNDEITHQDAKIIEEIHDQQVGLILVANKWDLIAERDTKVYTRKIYDHFPFVRWAPVQFTSALTKEKVNKVLDLILAVAEARRITLSENVLEKFLSKIVKKHLPVRAKGTKHPHIYDLKQSGINPPRFLIRIGASDTIHDSYVRFIENRLREKFGFFGTPISIGVIKNRSVHGQAAEHVMRNAKRASEDLTVKKISV